MELTVAYCMNLDRRIDRWVETREIWKQFEEKTGVKLIRKSGVDIPDDPAEGASQSVKRIVEQAKLENREFVFFIEDDLEFLDVNYTIECLQNLPENWDILLGGVYYYKPRERHSHWMKVGDFCALHFTIIKKTIFDKVLEAKSHEHIDRYLGYLSRKHEINVFVMHPMPCRQRAGYSDIRQKHTNDNLKSNLPWKF